jgi:cell division protein FtsN
MVTTDRRQTPRMKVKALAYVNLDPDNGGIILDISEGGLCFQSTGPVKQTETIRFWYSHRSHRIMARQVEAQTRGVLRLIEAGSELAWTDETRKKGGLRFTNLSAEAREQIREWIRQPELTIVNEKLLSAFPSSRESPFLGATQSDADAARHRPSRFEPLFRYMRSGWLGTGFSRGLVVGILVSAFIVTLLSIMSHRRQLGDSLIQAGERLGGRSWLQANSPEPKARSQQPRLTSPGPQPVSSEPIMVSADPKTVTPASIQAPQQEKLLSPATPIANKANGVKLQSASPAAHSLSASSIKPFDTPALSSAADGRSVPGIGINPASGPGVSMLRATAPELEMAKPPGVHIEPSKVEGNGMRSEKYLEVGRFKEKLLADKRTGQLSQLGFPATVIQWNRFWGKSYQVLVGPYGGDHEAEAAHKDLVSLGFKPRSYERGQRDFTLPRALKVGGTHLPVGSCVISWESYTPDAIVKIEGDRGMGVTVEGRWVNHGVSYTENAVVYQTNRGGSRTLVEIRFSGMGRALVFGSN